MAFWPLCDFTPKKFYLVKKRVDYCHGFPAIFFDTHEATEIVLLANW